VSVVQGERPLDGLRGRDDITWIARERERAAGNPFTTSIRLFLLLWLLPSPGMPIPRQQTASEPHVETAFLHVTVVDTNGGPSKRNYTVVTKGEYIDQVGSADQIKIPEGARTVDGRGKFLIPGLWDMHVHIGSNSAILPLYVANGVTGVRSMADSIRTIRQLREEIAQGKLNGPRIVATAGAIIDGPNPVWPGSVSAASESDGVGAVDKVIADGSDFAKVYDLLPRAAYFGVAKEAKVKEIAFVGHIPMAVTPSEASAAGQKSIEHLIGIPLACSSKEAYLRQEVLDAERKATSPWPALRAYRRADSMGADSYSAEKATALFSLFVKNGTWVVPTLTNTRASIYSADKRFANDPRLKDMPENLLSFWRPGENSRTLTAEERRSKDRAFKRYLEIVRTMHRSGVEILTGTDTPNPFSFPGSGLHDELKLLAEAGFTPLEALQAATRDAARFMGLLDSHGTVEKSKVADLVLLDADPLNDISNIDKISAVLLRGKLFDRHILEAFRKGANAASAAHKR
jgi:imidazolonepropionase-like amidohydrolase